MKIKEIGIKTISAFFIATLITPALALTYTAEAETSDDVKKIVVRAEIAKDIYLVVKCGISTGSAQKYLNSLENIGLSLNDAPFLVRVPLKMAIKPLTLDKYDSYCIAWNVPTPEAGAKPANAARSISNVQTWVEEDGSIQSGPAEKPSFWCGVDSSPVCYEVVSANGENVVGVSTCVEARKKDNDHLINSLVVSLGETPPEFAVTEANAVQEKKCSDRNPIWP